MPISATGNTRGRTGQRGFTLVEVLTVVLILGLVAGVVIFTLPDGDEPARREAFRLAARLKAAEEMAITTGSIIGLSADQSGYDFLSYEGGEWHEAALPGLGGAGHALEDNLMLTLTVTGEAMPGTAGGDRGFISFGLLGQGEEARQAPVPVLTFSPTGDRPSFEAVIAAPGEVWRVDGTGAVISVERDDG